MTDHCFQAKHAVDSLAVLQFIDTEDVNREFKGPGSVFQGKTIHVAGLMRQGSEAKRN